MLQPKFNVGNVTVSTEALCAMLVSGQDADFFLKKHASGDWGSGDSATQERGLREGSIVFSYYRTLWGKEIVVRTLLKKGETSVYCELNLPIGINHGFTYDAERDRPSSAAPKAGQSFKCDYMGVPEELSEGGPFPLYDVPGLVAPTHYASPAAPKEADPLIPGFKYNGNFGPVSGYPLADVPSLVTPTHDPCQAAPKEGDSVSPESPFKYDSNQPDYGPFASPIHKASPYYTGPTEPKKADPPKPKEEQP
jgi:hypothetical protein